jgi:hypothetical protein
MIQAIKEDIRVAVIFGPGSTMKPVWFDWRRRKHTIEKVTYAWQERRGAATLLHFAVTDGGGLYELVYDSVARTWSLATLDADPQ